MSNKVYSTLNNHMFIQHKANLGLQKPVSINNHCGLWHFKKAKTQCNNRAIFKSLCKGNVPCGNSSSENVHLDLIFHFLLTFAESFFFLSFFFRSVERSRVKGSWLNLTHL